ncbi:ATP-dependent DNA helicase RecG [Sulfurirhabdus autotrophica]|uniref:ATP-dependent DNA helicase RecG n=1 Tax=Sulfurirhabdus autotrophica TaxID=1706046 RepID=A0A4R3XYF8_9PROT|nr:ATP-dependent DNA helicase RecG [Sulfurirhabdus autotrophica]TCV84122.1 ATP-dependent DNA helicase RecG [Sulfurirhabdus autotrophica]
MSTVKPRKIRSTTSKDTGEATPPLIPGVSKPTLDKLTKLGISTPLDLILHLPLRYEDETHLYPIKHAPLNQTVLVEGTIIRADIKYRPKRTLICQVEDASGVLFIRFLNFYGSQVQSLSPGVKVRLLGEIRYGFFGLEMVHPKCRTLKEDTPLAECLTPIYPTTAGLSQTILNKLIKRTLSTIDLTDSLPEAIFSPLGLSGFAESVTYLHQPPPDASQHHLTEKTHPAWRRIKFDELLAQQLSMRLHYNKRHSQKAPRLKNPGQLKQQLLDTLPFSLTKAQQRVEKEISRDLNKAHPMQRLLQGDVGSGKTIVAALAAMQTIESGFQAAIMAPTEILAEQHYRKLSGWLEPIGISVAWLTASLPKKDKTAALQRVSDGSAQLAVGTHALFQEQVSFNKLGLAIIDEQHRFGVHQRLALRMKGMAEGAASKSQPHQLMMSATPIPRTLSMSYYADLDVSVIDKLPPGRSPVITKLVADSRRDEIIERIRQACLTGKQAYWVCPLIEESEKLQLQTALDTYQTISQTFPELKVGLVHGRMPNLEKSAMMAEFQSGNVQLLVATTVIEVGVDVPNASLMVIEHAERMGLSQLHQLRGRVGRGTSQSACILLYQSPLSDTARMRLKIIYENTDGFEISRQDLQLRGPGEFLGARQSGVPMLRFANLDQDSDLLEAARTTAELMLKEHKPAAESHLQRWLNNKEDYLKV